MILRNLNVNGSFNIAEFITEKDYISENAKPYDEHVLLKGLYLYNKYIFTFLIKQFRYLKNIIENIVIKQRLLIMS